MFGCNYQVDKCKTVLKLSEASIEYYWLKAKDVHGKDFSSLIENPAYSDIKSKLSTAVDFMKQLHPKRKRSTKDNICHIKTVPLLFELFLKLWHRFILILHAKKILHVENLDILNRLLTDVNSEIKKLANTVVIVA